MAQYVRGDQVVDGRSGEVGVVPKVEPAGVAMNGAAPRLRGEARARGRHRGRTCRSSRRPARARPRSSRSASPLLADGVEPAAIVAFTFTERAAASLKARIEARVAERLGAAVLDRIGGMFVGTIHAYCFRILQQHVPRYETLRRPRRQPAHRVPDARGEPHRHQAARRATLFNVDPDVPDEPRSHRERAAPAAPARRPAPGDLRAATCDRSSRTAS